MKMPGQMDEWKMPKAGYHQAGEEPFDTLVVHFGIGISKCLEMGVIPVNATTCMW